MYVSTKTRYLCAKRTVSNQSMYWHRRIYLPDFCKRVKVHFPSTQSMFLKSFLFVLIFFSRDLFVYEMVYCLPDFKSFVMKFQCFFFFCFFFFSPQHKRKKPQTNSNYYTYVVYFKQYQSRLFLKRNGD